MAPRIPPSVRAAVENELASGVPARDLMKRYPVSRTKIEEWRRTLGLKAQRIDKTARANQNRAKDRTILQCVVQLAGLPLAEYRAAHLQLCRAIQDGTLDAFAKTLLPDAA